MKITFQNPTQGPLITVSFDESATPIGSSAYALVGVSRIASPGLATLRSVAQTGQLASGAGGMGASGGAGLAGIAGPLALLGMLFATGDSPAQEPLTAVPASPPLTPDQLRCLANPYDMSFACMTVRSARVFVPVADSGLSTPNAAQAVTNQPPSATPDMSIPLPTGATTSTAHAPSQDPRVVSLLSQSDYIRSIAPPVLQALDTSGLSNDEAYTLLNAISVRDPNNGTSFKYLPGALVALTASGLSATEACNLLLVIIKETFNSLYAAFEELPKALIRLTNSGLSPAEARIMLMSFFEKVSKSDTWIFGIFSMAFTTLTQSGLTRSEAYGYLSATIETADPMDGYIIQKVLNQFPNAFAALIASGLTATQACDYLTTVIDKSIGGAKHALEYLPKFLTTLTDSGLSPADARTDFMTIVNKVRGHSKHAYDYIPHVFLNLTKMGLTNAQARDYLMATIDKAGLHTAEVVPRLDCPPSILFQNSETAENHRRTFLAHHMRVLKSCTDYNLVTVMKAFWDLAFIIAPAPIAVSHTYTELMADVMERYPRIGFNVLEGIVDTIKLGILPKNAAPDHATILNFVARSHGFVPVLYRTYLMYGERVFAELDAHARRITHEEMGLQDMQAIVAAHGRDGYDYLLAVIQRTSPTSGASFVERASQVDLLKKMMAAGDLRGHIPAVWQKQVKSFAIESGEYQLNQEATLDPRGHIKTLMQQLQLEPRTLTSSSKHAQELQRALNAHLIAYIQASSEDKTASMQGVQQALYALASSRETIRVQLGMVDDLDYTTLTLLEQLFTDKDNIPVLLQTEVNRITALANRNKPIVNIPGFAKQLTQLWTQDASAEDRQVRITGMLNGYRVTDLRALAQSPALPPEVREIVSDLAHQTSAVRPEQIESNVVKIILNDALTTIRNELGKFHYVKTAEITVGIRPVKGPAFGLYGLCSGVCTAEDMVAWKNPDYKLFAITLEGYNQAVGYVQAFEVRDGGKKYLTLPGINPSTEFLGTVQASELYPKLMTQITSFAKDAGYDAVLIPKAALIHSNRTGISKAIQRTGYPTHTFDKSIQWNNVRGHDFSETYVAWKK